MIDAVGEPQSVLVLGGSSEIALATVESLAADPASSGGVGGAAVGGNRSSGSAPGCVGHSLGGNDPVRRCRIPAAMVCSLMAFSMTGISTSCCCVSVSWEIKRKRKPIRRKPWRLPQSTTQAR